MIRMGRSSKTDDTSRETSALNDHSSTSAFPLSEVTQSNQNLAITESESMARDIKEGKLSGFVGAGTTLTGETNFQSMLRVDGHLTGRLTSEEGTLIIGSTGQVDANIDVGTAIVNGAVNGDIAVTEKLELGRTARIVGNIRAPRLVMEDGALLEGGCNMIQSKETLDNKIEEQNRQFATNELSPVSEEAAVDEVAEVEEESYVSVSETVDDADETDDEIEALEDDTADAATT